MKEKILKALTFIVVTSIVGYAAWQFIFMFVYGTLTGQLW